MIDTRRESPERLSPNPHRDYNPKLMAPNQLFYGDNLDVLRRYVRDESVDWVFR